jgi:hypothetical protein
MKALLALAVLISLPHLSIADAISSAQAKDHVGETATVCEMVADARYQERAVAMTSMATYKNAAHYSE